MSLPGIQQLDMKSPVGQPVVFYCVACRRNVQPLTMSYSPSIFGGACHGMHVVPRRSTPAGTECPEAGA